MLGPCVNCFNALILMVKIHIHIAHVFLSQVDPIQMQMLSFRSNVSLSALIFSDLASTRRERRMTWRALVLSVYLNWAFRLIHFHRPSPARNFVPLVKKGFFFLEAGAPSFQNACWKVSGKHTKLMLLTKKLVLHNCSFYCATVESTRRLGPIVILGFTPHQKYVVESEKVRK